MKYLRIASRVFNTPLLISADKAEIIGAVLLSRMRGAVDDTDDLDELIEEERTVEKAGSIAVISIAGSLVHKASGMMAASGMRSYLDIAADVDSALADTNVKGILLRVDSPGGEVAGAFDCADSIYAAAQKKPVWALSEDNALSAGYLLASQASKLYVTQTGLVGSIGIIMMHFDQSQADKQDGVKVTTLYRGKHKADFNPHAPLSEGARDWANEHLDARYAQFVSAVARGRNGLSESAIESTEAGLFSGPEAVKLRLADGILSYQNLLSEFSASLTSSKQSGRRTSLATASAGAISPQKEGTRVSELNQPADVAAAPELRKQIRSEVLAEVAEVAAFCEVAGRPNLTAGCIEQLIAGKSKADVFKHVQQVKASAAAPEEQIDSAITAEAGARIDQKARYQAGAQAKLGMSLADMQKKAQGVK